MAITHTETVTSLTVLNDGTDVVSIIDITTVSVDDSDPSNLTRTFYDTYKVDTSGGASAAGFVEYGNLTEDVVKGWIADELAASERKALAVAWIEELKNPPTPSEVSKALPW